MLLALASLLTVAQLAASESPSSAVASDPDSAALEMVRRAREHRDSTATEIEAYQAIGRERISVGLRTFGRERLLYRRELSARLHWRRDGGGRLEVLGARQVAPSFSRGVKVPDELGGKAAGLAFDPADDRFFGDMVGVARESGEDGDSWIRHPLASGNEVDYRYRVGDTTSIRLADGSRIRLIELEVIPRRSDSRLLRGSLWLDASTYGPVRGVFRLERAFDLQLDSRYFDPESQSEVRDIPLLVRPVILPLRADMHLLTIEYALWEGRWWLPRLMAIDAIAEVGVLGGLPVRFERLYGDFRVSGEPGRPATPPLAADSLSSGCPDTSRRSGRRRAASGGEEAPGAGSGDEEGDASVASGRESVCECKNGHCMVWDVEIADTTELLRGEYLPATIFGDIDEFIGSTEARELADRLRRLAPAPWALSRPVVRWRFADGDLLRYNRIEALSIGGRAEVELTALRTDATARFGIADRRPDVELGLARDGFTRRTRLAAYHRLEAIDPAQRPFGLGSSLSALVLGRDDGDYFRSRGFELIGTPGRGRAQNHRWRIYAEQQREATKETDVSLPHLIDGGHLFRPNHPADEANQIGASFSVIVARGLSPGAFRWQSEIFVEGSTGSYTFARPSLALTAAFPLGEVLSGAVQLAGGTSVGDIPAQKQWLIGGAPSVRGFAPAALTGTAFWHARGEIATQLPGARLVLFSDAGWAGDRDRVDFDPALLSAGAGASFLDGLVRFDLARALRGGDRWRFEAYINGSL